MKKKAVLLFCVTAMLVSAFYISANAVYYDEISPDGRELYVETDENVVAENIKSDTKTDYEDETGVKTITADKIWFFKSFTFPFVICAACVAGLFFAFSYIDKKSFRVGNKDVIEK